MASSKYTALLEVGTENVDQFVLSLQLIVELPPAHCTGPAFVVDGMSVVAAKTIQASRAIEFRILLCMIG
jgi:hypothetical protein